MSPERFLETYCCSTQQSARSTRPENSPFFTWRREKIELQITCDYFPIKRSLVFSKQNIIHLREIEFISFLCFDYLFRISSPRTKSRSEKFKLHFFYKTRRVERRKSFNLLKLDGGEWKPTKQDELIIEFRVPLRLFLQRELSELSFNCTAENWPKTPMIDWLSFPEAARDLLGNKCNFLIDSLRLNYSTNFLAEFSVRTNIDWVFPIKINEMTLTVGNHWFSGLLISLPAENEFVILSGERKWAWTMIS